MKDGKSPISRRRFLQTSMAAAAVGAGIQSPLVKGLVPGANAAGSRPDKDITSHYTACDMCFNRCGMIARKKNGVIKKLDPNPNCRKSRGMICAKGNAGIQHVYNPDRLKHPLKRKGKRGEGKWERISWEEALDHTAEQMQKIADEYSRCGIMFTPGVDAQSRFVEMFAEVFGSYNFTNHESLCLLSRNRAYLDTFGEVPTADVLHSRYIIIAGSNPLEAIMTPDTPDLVEARKNGCKIVVLDPRFTKTAALADEWHQIKPGTDMAFFLAMCHEIVKGERFCCPDNTHGYDKFVEHIKDYTPEWAEKECGIPAEDIKRISKEITEAAPRAMVYPGRRSSDYKQSTQIRRAMAIANVLLDNWDRPGGLMATREVGVRGWDYSPPFYPENPPDRADADQVPGLFSDIGSFQLLREAIIKQEPYPIRGWFSFKTNFLQTGANRQKTIKMLENIDFFVNIDIMMSDTAWYADIVLPGNSFLEREDPVTALQGSSACACAFLRDPVIDNMFESRPPLWILQELAKRMDLEEHFDFTMDEYREAQLRDLEGALEIMRQDGIYFNPSQAYGIYAGDPLKTMSGVKEIYNQRYEQWGIEPMPVYNPPQMPDKDEFRLIVGRPAYFTQSRTNNELLTEFMEENTLHMNPDAAQRLGLEDGDLVEVESSSGKGRLRLEIDGGIEKQTVYMVTGFGSLSPQMSQIYQKGASIAEIQEDAYDEICANMAMHETFVNVRKVS
ncbi:molybdopterin-dependent oxidoreductase [Desulfonatronospira sp. MSAO_Bac3]|uniref:molybdopterin-containing oxidoreductase family protein n=1 Tax=Desulfonatronospira sp. MSAO_Bac3 TaxID=2293857 RepID=UPI000FF08924|nr:molybdopterin-dependent oxidoreductase [Desulfonatronospira sp. MSAO_Bac3]RQD78626.1 MAG: twin-arginine translocation signal domain-containing protein [Desulfonatronospira sp. MSAO_Bac3]